ncbi:hypothetical protein JCM10908_004581 [Rhodotorula pacifica]|uniref:Bcd1p n=1 Tax=Rhodotorula pacifica TaxID=1495444 RepID=UPI00316F25DB
MAEQEGIASTSKSRLGTCQQCNAAPARYRCPGCELTTCSLACSTAHKQEKACDGVAPPIWSKLLQANELSWGSLMRDQSYIAQVGRAVEGVGKQLVSDKVLPQGRMAARPGDAQGVRIDERSDKEERLVREARNEGVELTLLPKGMSKRLKNGSRWDPKHNRLEWTVEVAFQPRLPADASTPLPPPTLITTVPQPSTNTIHSVITAALGSRDKKGKGKAVEPEKEEWLRIEKAWLETIRPPSTNKGKEKNKVQEVKAEANEESVEEAGIVEVEPPAVVEPAPDPAAQSFDLLLAFFSRSQHAPPPLPSESSDSDEDDDDDETDSESGESSASSSDEEDNVEDVGFAAHAALAPTPIEPPKPVIPVIQATARRLYRIPVTRATTLREALAGATLLEIPLLEVWPRETLQQQVSQGKIEVLDKPTVEQAAAARRAADEARNASRGRGRGRGRGGFSGGGGMGGRGGHMPSAGRGHARGAYGGGYGARGESSYGRSGERTVDGGTTGGERQQDSGWGKRGPPAQEGAGAEKRMRTAE